MSGVRGRLSDQINVSEAGGTIDMAWPYIHRFLVPWVGHGCGYIVTLLVQKLHGTIWFALPSGLLSTHKHFSTQESMLHPIGVPERSYG
jgi:hypothetical protein